MVLACRSRERGEAAAFDLRQVREGGALEGGAWREGEQRTEKSRVAGDIGAGVSSPLKDNAARFSKWRSGCTGALVTQRRDTRSEGSNCCSKTFKNQWKLL